MSNKKVALDFREDFGENKEEDPIKLGEKEFESGNYNNAKKYFEISMKNFNNEKAQVNLGIMYFQGSGVKQNLLKAQYLFWPLAYKGNANAQNGLAVALRCGNDWSKEIEKWFMRAALQGHIEAKFALGQHYTNDYKEQNNKKAIKWLNEVVNEKGVGDKEDFILATTHDKKYLIDWARKSLIDIERRENFSIKSVVKEIFDEGIRI